MQVPIYALYKLWEYVLYPYLTAPSSKVSLLKALCFIEPPRVCVVAVCAFFDGGIWCEQRRRTGLWRRHS